jgi:hypothetical protein
LHLVVASGVGEAGDVDSEDHAMLGAVDARHVPGRPLG